MDIISPAGTGRSVRILTVAVVMVLMAAAAALFAAGDADSNRVRTAAGSTTTAPEKAKKSPSKVQGEGGPGTTGVGKAGSAQGAGKTGSAKGSAGGATAAAGAGGGGSGSSSGGGATPPPSGPTSTLPLSHGAATTENLTAGGRVVKGAGSHSTQTDSISPTGSGTIFVWVLNLVGADEVAPVPSISGLGLTWSVVHTAQKKDDAPRRYTVLAAQHAGPPPPGPLTIEFGAELNSSTWVWDVMQTNRTRVLQTAENTAGNWETAHDVTLAMTPQPGSITIAGFGMGQHDPIRPGAGLAALGQGVGPSPPSSSFVEWSPAGAQRLDCTWDTAAHAMGIALELI
jgi:hypothetical protein